VARLGDYDLGKIFNDKVVLLHMCEVSVQLREVSSNPFDLNTKIWMLGLGHQPDILTNNSEPCLKDAKGDGEAVEQVI